MTTNNHFIGAVSACYKRAIREQKKNTIEAVKRLQQKLKQQIKDNSVNAVGTYNEYVASLVSIHKIDSETIDWESLARAPHPKLPLKELKNQFEAEYNYQTYEPTFVDYLTLQHRKKMRELLDKIELAKHADDLVYNAILKEFRNDAIEWKKIQTITKGIHERDLVAYQKAIDFFDPFASVSRPGMRPICETFDDHIVVDLHLNAGKVIPDYLLTKTADGKLSNTLLEASAYNQLLYDYVCACTLRVARETFALLPVNFVFVNVRAEVFDRSTETLENKTVLSIKFDTENLRKLNFNRMTCADLIAVFSHEPINN